MRLIADLHVHTVSSGHAYSTVKEYVDRARKIGLKAIGITDHGPVMPGGPHAYHFSNMKMIPDKIDGVRIFRGVEANVIDAAGKIDLTEDDLARLDIVMVAMHPRCGYENQGEEKNTDVLARALENRYINVIAHPGNPKYPVNLEQVVAIAKEKKVVLEVNNSSFTSRVGSWPRCLAIAKEVKRQDWKVVLGTDSHIFTMLGNFGEALKLIREAGLTEDHVINTSFDKIDKYLLRK